MPPILWELARRIWRLFQPPEGAGLPERELAVLFPGISQALVEIPASEWKREGGLLPLAELLVLAAIAKHLRPHLILEIGTFKGSTTLVLARNTPGEVEIYTLDLPPGSRQMVYPLEIGVIAHTPFQAGERFRGTQVANRIHQVYGDSATFDFSPFHGKAGLVFVDGNHSYENVRADSLNAFRCLSPGGVIIWDDYHPSYGPGVMRALDELRERPVFRIAGTRLAIFSGRA